MGTVQISKLQQKDLAEFNTFYSLSFDYQSDIDTLHRKWAEINANPDYTLLTARIDGELCGYLMAVIIQDLVGDGTPFMTLWSVCVHPDYRRRGIGKQLILHAEEIANIHRCEFITFISGHQRKEAHQFYEQLGYDLKREAAGIKFLV